MKKKYWMIICAFLSGVLLVELSGMQLKGTLSFDAYFWNHFVNQSVSWKDLFLLVLWNRVRLFAGIALIASTRLKELLRRVWAGILFFFAGCYSAICILHMGLAGVGVFVLSVFPQWFLYVLLMFLLLHKKKPVQYGGKRYVLTQIVTVFLFLMLLGIGCLLEATVSNQLLKWWVRGML